METPTAIKTTPNQAKAGTSPSIPQLQIRLISSPVSQIAERQSIGADWKLSRAKQPSPRYTKQNRYRGNGFWLDLENSGILTSAG